MADDDRIPALLSAGREITDPDEAEALGLTVEARRLRESAKTNPLVAEIRAQLDAADGMVDDTIAFVLSIAATAARERARAIAGRPGDGPPDPRYPVYGETRIQRAEGWYQTADWLETGKEPT